jgi:ABC-2 type transport system permease protein
MTAMGALLTVTLRGLLGRRRMLLMLLLAALPVIVGLIIRVAGGSPNTAQILDALVIRTVLPLVALIIGTAAIGSEIEDGTAAVLVVPPIVLTGILVAGVGGESLGTTFGFALAAMAGGIAYAWAFTALGTITSRALIVGLAYTLLWEGVLAGLLEGTRFLSIRQATLGLAAAWTGHDTGRAALDPVTAAAVIGVVIAGAFGLTALALARFQIRSAD